MKPEDRRKKQRSNQEYFSGKISELSRYTGFGLAAIAYTFVSAESAFYQELSDNRKYLILVAGFCGCLAILLEYIQYLVGLFAASCAASNHEGNYEQTNLGKFFRLIQETAFYSKQAASLAGILSLLTALYPGL